MGSKRPPSFVPLNTVSAAALGTFVLGSLAAIAAACGSDDSSTPPAPDASVAPDSGAGTGDDAATFDATASDGAPLADASADAADGDAGPLEAGASCMSDDECASLGCDDTGHCALARSCTQSNGGLTCGPDGGDSCCQSIAIPRLDGGADAGYVLDKYSVTAGRFRVFITKTGGNVRGYVQAHRPSWFDPGWDSFLPTEMDDGTQVTGVDHVFTGDAGRDGVYQQLGPIHYGVEGPGNEGCLTKEVGNARTYRLPDEVNTTDFNDVQQYSQDDLDPKPMQCATFYMLAAFCIWDGGRIPTLDELSYAWTEGDAGTHAYPWGNKPVPGGYDYPFPTQAIALADGKETPDGSVDDYANHLYNWWSPASGIACLGNDAQACDYSVYVAPPGRFPKGNGPFGHADLAGDVYNVAMPPVSSSDPTTLQAGLGRTGAFDAHAIQEKGDFGSYLATNKYLAVGARCAR
jgi:formylglycine-generating enzyme required for sulfatase activity